LFYKGCFTVEDVTETRILRGSGVVIVNLHGEGAGEVIFEEEGNNQLTPSSA